MSRRVPLLVTMDLEIARDHDRAEQHVALHRLDRSCAALGLPMTVFCTADAADEFTGEVKDLARAGHEIGSHGVTHGKEERFHALPGAIVDHLICEGTRRLERHTRMRPICFRGPGMSTSAATQRALVRHGYGADFSVCPQRLDFLHSRGGTPWWLTSPRRPYRPSPASPYREGTLPLRVVPLSSVGLPFISGVLYLLGLQFMKAFFDVLLREARSRNTAIVYLFHSYEFAARRPAADPAWVEAGPPVPSPRLHRLYEQDRERRYSANLALLTHMVRHTQVAPMTGAHLLQHLAEAPSA
jgi:hypothetical protein